MMIQKFYTFVKIQSFSFVDQCRDHLFFYNYNFVFAKVFQNYYLNCYHLRKYHQNLLTLDFNYIIKLKADLPSQPDHLIPNLFLIFDFTWYFIHSYFLQRFYETHVMSINLNLIVIEVMLSPPLIRLCSI